MHKLDKKLCHGNYKG